MITDSVLGLEMLTQHLLRDLIGFKFRLQRLEDREVVRQRGEILVVDLRAKGVTGKVADYDFAAQMIAQTKGVLLTVVWSGVGTAIILFVISIIFGLRVTVDKEREGLDLTEHGERAYNM